MTIIEYIKLGLRHLTTILTITVISTIFGLWYQQGHKETNYNNTALYVISIKNQPQNTSLYENLQAADLITESIQGWFKDPSFISSIHKKSGFNYEIKSKKQEKNNLLITFSSEKIENAIIFSSYIEQAVRERMHDFNKISELNLDLLASEINSAPIPDKLSIVLIFFVLSGLILGFIFAIFYEKYFTKLQSMEQIKNSFIETGKGEYEVFKFKNQKDLNKTPHYLIKYIELNFDNSELQIIDLCSNTRKQKEKISNETFLKQGKFKNINSYILPKDIREISIQKPTLIFIKFGKTSIQELFSLLKLGLEKAVFVVFD